MLNLLLLIINLKICFEEANPFVFSWYKGSVLPDTATLNEFFMLWRVRKKVSIPLKAPEAPLFKYVN